MRFETLFNFISEIMSEKLFVEIGSFVKNILSFASIVYERMGVCYVEMKNIFDRHVSTSYSD